MNILDWLKPSVKNDIQFNIQTIKQPYRKFVEDTIAEANSLGVRVVLSEDRQVVLDAEAGTTCNGYFCDEEMTLATACGQDFDAWFSVFIHESSHMDQWKEQDPTWTASAAEMAGVQVGVVLDLWLQGYVEANPDQLKKIIAPTREVELNCERRTIQKILDQNIPMDIEKYARRASSYVYFYNVMATSRKWYTIGKEPYNIPEILAVMPTTLDGDYSETPPHIFQTYVEHMIGS